jgi:hypothetical protein
MFNNYAAHIGILTNVGSQRIITAKVKWDFNSGIILGYGGDNIDNSGDRPRINFWRSDSQYTQYVSGGRYVLYPMPTGDLTEPWGNRNTGDYTFQIPLSGSLYAGIDLFTHSYLLPTGLNPPSNEWTVTTNNESNEVKYQYRFKNNEISKNITIELGTGICGRPSIPTRSPGQKIIYSVDGNNCPKFTLLSGFWSFNTATNKAISNFKITSNGTVNINWGDDTTQTAAISNITYNHKFEK